MIYIRETSRQKYTIILESDLFNLSRMVNMHIDVGYEPIGNPFEVLSKDHTPSKWAQAIIRRKETV